MGVKVPFKLFPSMILYALAVHKFWSIPIITRYLLSEMPQEATDLDAQDKSHNRMI
jgi:hypothetical protein